MIEQYPESLLEIRGISRNKLDMILKSYGGNHVIRELAAELAPFSISPKKIQKVYEEFGEDAVDVVRNRPFCLCRISGFSFLAADEIARKIMAALRIRIAWRRGYCTVWSRRPRRDIFTRI